MASKYSEADKARVYVLLATNDGNVKRTSRDSGLPESTVRMWKRDFEINGPPALDEEIQAEVGDFVGEAVTVRWKALRVLDSKIADAKPSELIAVIGVLTDKIDRARGLAIGRVEHVHALPSPEEIRESLGAALQGVLEAAKQRQFEIVDAEIVEQSLKELPTGQPKE